MSSRLLKLKDTSWEKVEAMALETTSPRSGVDCGSWGVDGGEVLTILVDGTGRLEIVAADLWTGWMLTGCGGSGLPIRVPAEI